MANHDAAPGRRRFLARTGVGAMLAAAGPLGLSALARAQPAGAAPLSIEPMTSARPPKAPIGSPPPITLPKQVRSGRTSMSC